MLHIHQHRLLIEKWKYDKDFQYILSTLKIKVSGGASVRMKLTKE